MFVGSKFCSHCGARADRGAEETATHQRCPRCRVDLNAIVVGQTNLRECPKCEGIWVDTATLEQICSDRERQSAVLGMAAPLPEPAEGDVEKNIRYVPCPVCGALMNRVNFAHCSHVVVDVCAKHGTWFDKDELRRIIEFIRAGGLEQARQNQLAELEAKERALRVAQAAQANDARCGNLDYGYEDYHLGLSRAAEGLLDLFTRGRGLF